jgi:uncharacterized protein (TIGR02246 family)
MMNVDAPEHLVPAWVAEFNSQQVPRIVALYAEDATLFGTSKGPLRTGREEIHAYFPGTSTVELVEQRIARLGDDHALAAGTYLFRRVRGGQPETVQARFTFAMRRAQDSWQIIHHHSSAFPTA